MKTLILLFGLILITTVSALAQRSTKTTSLRFEVTIARGLVSRPQQGRVFVFLSRAANPEPRFAIDDEVSLEAPPILAKDVAGFASAKTVAVIDSSSIIYPINNLADLPAGNYYVQALLDTNIDLRSLNAPGNLYSRTQRVSLDARRGGTVKIELAQSVPPEQMPAETEYLKYVRLESTLLSKFHSRPIYLRAGIILPRDYVSESDRRYPLRVRIGGYGSKFTRVQQLMDEKSNFRKAWLADDTPRMILVFLDGDGPYGDAYQINSANNGPYGDALTQELIPFIEQRFRAVGQPHARVLDGGSTGGWVSLALQIFYPDYFNGTWSGFPDPVDFNAYQLVNIYKDQNAYVNKHGIDRPSARDLNGDTRFTIRLECLKENVLGAGDSYTMSGGQWGAWNAVFSPRGADKRPTPLWDAKTGKINLEIAEQWRKYDLRSVLEQNWNALAPKLSGKLHIWVGEADEYFLNNAVHLLEDYLRKADPYYDFSIIYGPGKGHGWFPTGDGKVNDGEMMKEMMRAIEKSKP